MALTVNSQTGANGNRGYVPRPGGRGLDIVGAGALALPWTERFGKATRFYGISASVDTFVMVARGDKTMVATDIGTEMALMASLHIWTRDHLRIDMPMDPEGVTVFSSGNAYITSFFEMTRCGCD